MKRFSIALDTCVGSGSLAVYEEGELKCSIKGFLDRSSEVSPLEALESFLNGEGLRIGGLKELFLTRGPGSFTGVRTGLSIAKGLRQAMELKVRTCTVFGALSVLGGDSAFATAVFAGSREVACQKWPGAGGCDPLGAHRIVSISELKSYLSGKGVSCIIAEPRAFAVVKEAGLAGGAMQIVNSREDVSGLARESILKCQGVCPDDILEPLYTREFAPGK